MADQHMSSPWDYQAAAAELRKALSEKGFPFEETALERLVYASVECGDEKEAKARLAVLKQKYPDGKRTRMAEDHVKSLKYRTSK